MNICKCIICNLYQSNPKGFITVLEMWFLLILMKTSKLRKTPLRTGLSAGTGYNCMDDDARKLVCDVDLVSKVKNDENWFLVLDNGTGTGCRI